MPFQCWDYKFKSSHPEFPGFWGIKLRSSHSLYRLNYVSSPVCLVGLVWLCLFAFERALYILYVYNCWVNISTIIFTQKWFLIQVRSLKKFLMSRNLNRFQNGPGLRPGCSHPCLTLGIVDFLLSCGWEWQIRPVAGSCAFLATEMWKRFSCA